MKLFKFRIGSGAFPWLFVEKRVDSNTVESTAQVEFNALSAYHQVKNCPWTVALCVSLMFSFPGILFEI
jgi:hypothetical protein